MKLLALILSVMTWTVTSWNSVSGDGTWPYDIEVSFRNSNKSAGQVTKGNVATLTLANLGGMTVHKIELNLRANQGSGAGTIAVTADDMPLASKDVTYKQVSAPVVVFDGQKDDVHGLSVSVVATQNSLYVDAFTITYAPTPPRTVTLMKGNELFASLTETQGYQGVILPALPDLAEWKFIGWSETEIWTTTDLPPVQAANTRYYPLEDCTLWAAYRYHPEQETGYMTDLQSGVYKYVNRQTRIALSGIPEEGIMNSEPINDNTQNQYYYIEFVGVDTAYITHEATGIPIGHSGTLMESIASPWRVFHEGDETFFYIQEKGKTYVLWLNILSSDMSYKYAGLLQTTLVSGTPLALQIPQESGDPLFTCHPENPQSIEQTYETKCKWAMPFGPFELIINEGRKELHLQQ